MRHGKTMRVKSFAAILVVGVTILLSKVATAGLLHHMTLKYGLKMNMFGDGIVLPDIMMSHQESEQHLCRMATPWPELLLIKDCVHDSGFWKVPEKPLTMNYETSLIDLAQPSFRWYGLMPVKEHEESLACSLGFHQARGDLVCGPYIFRDPPLLVPFDYPWCRGMSAPEALPWLATQDALAP
ncbi:MAG: hypothetical protein HS117_18285 [Verrucomicrobiaceae bacterium]|nr:hypothetical protein [Verrucomicrobiaceae bacterium]